MYFPCFLNRKRIKMPKSTQNLQPKSYVVKCAKIEKKKKIHFTMNTNPIWSQICYT